VLFRNPKLVHSISIHLIRVICGGSIRDEKQHIPADFSILPVNGYGICNREYVESPFTGLIKANGVTGHLPGRFHTEPRIACHRENVDESRLKILRAAQRF
jgi:hypothetical protein